MSSEMRARSGGENINNNLCRHGTRKISGNPSVEVVDPIHLLNRCASYDDYTSNGNQFIEYYSYDKDIDTIIDKLASSSKIDYALTSLSARGLSHLRQTNRPGSIRQLEI
ncbi:MAG: hypothetical protein ACREBS_10830 [Nitrososphaerales archaeon]